MPYRGHLGASPDPLGWVTPETGKRRLRDTTVPEQPQWRKEEEVGRLRSSGLGFSFDATLRGTFPGGVLRTRSSPSP